MHEVGSKKKTYLVHPGLKDDPDLHGYVMVKKAVPYVTHHKPAKKGLWPISVEHSDNTWVRSALNIVEDTAIEWLKVIPMPTLGEYVTRSPSVVFPEPNWAALPPSIFEWLDAAFPEADWLTPDNWADHPVRKALREGG